MFCLTVCDKTYQNTDGEIRSPLFESTSGYPANTKCTYTILASDNKHVS